MIRKRPSGRRCFPGRWFKCSALALTIIAQPGIKPLEAQSQTTWAPKVVAPDELLNVYADWPGEQAAEAISIDLPAGWEVVEADAVNLNRDDRIPLDLRASVGGVLAEAPQSLFGPHRFILTLRSPHSPATSSISIVPMTRSGESDVLRPESHSRYEFEYDIRVESARQTSRKALRLDESSRYLSVGSENLPFMDAAEGLTVAFWLKTVDRNSIPLSTWNGDGHRDYPFEFVIGADGQVRLFAGRMGMHYSLTSSKPVADGAWHHLAYSVDFQSGRAILAVDGEQADALLLPDMSGVQPDQLFIGGRGGDEGSLTGTVDEIVLVSSARTALQLQRLARLPADAYRQEPGVLVLDFESRRSLSILNRPVSDENLVPSGLTLHEPVSNVVAEVHPGTVVLTWTVERPEKQELVVERSEDGLQFEPVQRIEIGEIELQRMMDHEPFSFEDFVSDESPIRFYRLRQEFDDGAVLESQMIKVGIGTAEVPTHVELLGNSPNPFSTVTEITFRVDEPAPLRLSVWSLSGHLVDQLANETGEIGLHRIPFEAHNLPSGTYFLRLETEEGIQTRKMIIRR